MEQRFAVEIISSFPLIKLCSLHAVFISIHAACLQITTNLQIFNHLHVFSEINLFKTK